MPFPLALFTFSLHKTIREIQGEAENQAGSQCMPPAEMQTMQSEQRAFARIHRDQLRF